MNMHATRTAARKRYKVLLSRYAAICKLVRNAGGDKTADPALLVERAAVLTEMAIVAKLTY